MVYDDQWGQEWGDLSAINDFSLHNGSILVYGRGWPLLSLYSSYYIDSFYFGDWTLEPRSSGIELPAFQLNQLPKFICEKRSLPLYPIWSGFAINTIFYSVLLWLLTLGPFTARRMIRNKRGLCIKCGYDLRGTSTTGCPECGYGREAEV